MASWVSEMDSEEKIWDRWEEVVVSNDRGRREVHYYLRDCGGGRDLAVVGREKSARHMSYVVPSKFLQSLARISATAFPSGAAAAAGTVPWDLKWRSRREVVDWLSSLVSEYGVSAFNGYSDDEDAGPTTIPISKSLSIGKMGLHPQKFSWLGSAWECRKRRRHYRSFCRNGVTISVHEFVYVMAEDCKRLVAYVEDLYEDSKANYMVVVRWFHKVDEVGIVLPPDTNDREIFFSLCLQHFSVECIDGVAAVLGLQDFEKFQKEARQMCSSWEPYLCRRQMDIDDIKPFDVTQVQGYWSQDVLRSLYSSSLKLRLKIKCHGSTLDINKNTSDPQRSSKTKTHSGCEERGLESSKSKSSSIRIRSTPGTAALTLHRKQLATQTLTVQQHLIVPGLEIELLSQDSGIRGCWFRGVVLKRRRDMIKVQYHDVEDADGTGNLEEWVSVSRVAAADKLGIRINGRPMVRPRPSHLSKGLCSYGVGKVVDAWWHDGWWEGIVISDKSEGKIHVYFPGEQQISIFTSGDLRPSQDWVDNKWNNMKDKPNIASLASTDLEREKLSECITFQALTSDCPDDAEPSEERGDCFPLSGAQLAAVCSQEKKESSIPDLIDFNHDSLKWNSTRKRSRSRKLFATELWGCKRQRVVISCRDSRNVESKESKKCSAFVIPKSLKAVDRDHCKNGDPLFGAPMTLCSNLVMTR